MNRKLVILVCFTLLAVGIGVIVWQKQMKPVPNVSQVDDAQLNPRIQVLLHSSAKNDEVHKSSFFDAFFTLFRENHLRFDDYYFVDRGFAVEKGSRIVVVLRGWNHMIPGSDTQQLILFDRGGKVLDRVSCDINSRLTGETDGTATFRTDVLEKPTRDGAELVIRYVPEKGESMYGNWSHDLTHEGTIYTFRWDPDLPMNARPPDWAGKGLCRLAVRGNKFKILFPKPDLSYRTVKLQKGTR